MLRPAAIICVLAALSGAGAAYAQQAKALDYDTFCKLTDEESKRAAFVATTAESRGILVTTQLERWRDANQTRLDDKQKGALETLIKSITADTYGTGPAAQEALLKSRAASSEVERLFARDDLNAMQPSAPCIAKK